MAKIKLHIGRNGSGYKVGYFTGNPKPLDRVVELVPSVGHFYHVGEDLSEIGVSGVDLLPVLQNPRAVKDNLANKLVHAEGSQAMIFIGSLKMVDEQINLFGDNHALRGLPDEELANIYREVKKALDVKKA
ncbi:MAG TPA: hypothetical protein VI544_00560 [Candidatus Nanoarchaeia archaeon]|nr:hypothetical protein [Candidatus Nanoarchaeia archaeon]